MNIFLLRGLVRESRHWGEFKQLMQDQFPEHHIYTPEIQGVGQYSHLTSPDNFDDMIHFMREKYKKEIEGSENCIFAMSLGGMMAKRWTELYPQDFKFMVLVNTSFKGINPLLQRLRPLSVLNFFKIFLTPGTESRENAIVKMVSNNDAAHGKIVKEWINIQKQAPVSRASFLNQIKAALTFSPAKEPPKTKLLILAGEKDRLCNVRCSYRLHGLWGGDLRIHPSAGHDLPIDDGQWIIGQLKSFI